MESPLVCIVDIDLLESRSKILNLNINFTEIQSLKAAKENRLGTVQFIQAGKCKDLSPGTLNPKNSKYILDNLNFGISQSLKNKKVGLVTGPIQKSNIIDGGFTSFQGIEFKENYMPKKYAVAILPIAGFLTTIGAVISFVKKV